MKSAQRSSAAQRQRAYRQRVKRAATDAIGFESEASRVALVALLGRCCAVLEDRPRSAETIEAYRNSLRRVLNEIVTRYGVEL